MTKIKKNYYFSKCLESGVLIYPIYFDEDKIISENNYKGNNWYIQVNNNGKLTTYKESIGSGTILKSFNKKTKKGKGKISKWCNDMHKLYEHWYFKIKK